MREGAVYGKGDGRASRRSWKRPLAPLAARPSHHLLAALDHHDALKATYDINNPRTVGTRVNCSSL